MQPRPQPYPLTIKNQFRARVILALCASQFRDRSELYELEKIFRRASEGHAITEEQHQIIQNVFHTYLSLESEVT